MELFIFKNTPVYSFMHTVGRIVHVTPIPHTTHITFSNLRTVANISVCNILLSWEESHGKHSRASHSNGTSVVSLLQLWDSMSTQPHSALLQFPHQPRHRGQVVWRSKRETSAPLERGPSLPPSTNTHISTGLNSALKFYTWPGKVLPSLVQQKEQNPLYVQSFLMPPKLSLSHLQVGVFSPLHPILSI